MLEKIESENIVIIGCKIEIDLTPKWYQFIRRFKNWRWKRWREKHPEEAKMYDNQTNELVNEVDNFLAYGGAEQNHVSKI